jgi:hypothetical protein
MRHDGVDHPHLEGLLGAVVSPSAAPSSFVAADHGADLGPDRRERSVRVLPGAATIGTDASPGDYRSRSRSALPDGQINRGAWFFCVQTRDRVRVEASTL